MIRTLLIFFGGLLATVLIGFFLGLGISVFMTYEPEKEFVVNYFFAIFLSSIFAIFFSFNFWKGIWIAFRKKKRRND